MNKRQAMSMSNNSTYGALGNRYYPDFSDCQDIDRKELLPLDIIYLNKKNFKYQMKIKTLFLMRY